LILGRDAAGTLPGAELSSDDQKMDAALEALYASDRTGGLGGSRPSVARWLGDIRAYFPSSVVQVLQRDAIDRLGLRQLLLEPELLAEVEPDVHLVADLVALGSVIPERTRETARQVVRQVVDHLERRLAQRLVASVTGALDRSTRTRRPRLPEVDWDRTIRANLRTYDPELGTIVPERLVGHGRRRRRAELKHVVVCADQSGSMATSVVHAGVLACVLATIRSLRTSLVVFDTEVADLSDDLHDPVDLLFGIQLGGGTDIARAVAYCQRLVVRPADTVLVLVTDLFEGGDPDQLRARLGGMVRAGVTVVCLLALTDSGAPAHDHELAAHLAALGVACFACTPDRFPDLMAAALEGRDVAAWADLEGIPTTRPAS
ncbi:MAG: VWA domain-containing protein, partial [Actinomycetota bacterium]|nr:VWA domain-containing protein [Actinomycetota bacterium]